MEYYDLMAVVRFILLSPVLLVFVLEIAPRIPRTSSRRQRDLFLTLVFTPVLLPMVYYMNEGQLYWTQKRIMKVLRSAFIMYTLPYYILFKPNRTPKRAPPKVVDEKFSTFQLEIWSRSSQLTQRSQEILDMRSNMPQWVPRASPLTHFPVETEGRLGAAIVETWSQNKGDIKMTRKQVLQQTEGRHCITAADIAAALLQLTHEFDGTVSPQKRERLINEYDLNLLQKYDTHDLTLEEKYLLDSKSKLSLHAYTTLTSEERLAAAFQSSVANRVIRAWHQHNGNTKKVKVQVMREFRKKRPVSTRFIFVCIYSYERLTKMNFWEGKETCVKCWTSANKRHSNNLLARLIFIYLQFWISISTFRYRIIKRTRYAVWWLEGWILWAFFEVENGLWQAAWDIEWLTGLAVDKIWEVSDRWRVDRFLF